MDHKRNKKYTWSIKETKNIHGVLSNFKTIHQKLSLIK